MIEVRELYKAFEDKQVLSDVSLQIDEGETFAVIGQSGSGKSVLMKHIIGLLNPDHGNVYVDNVNIHTLPYSDLRKLRRRFGVLFQGGALFDSMTTFENIAFPMRMFAKMTEEGINERVMECLDLVHMPEAANKTTAELSGGMKKRAALARAIALSPDYIFYDEPTSGLDPQTSRTINELISALADSLNITSVVISHDMHSVLSIADRIAFIHEGRIHWSGSVNDLHNAIDKELLDFVKASEYQIGSTGAGDSPDPVS